MSAVLMEDRAVFMLPSLPHLCWRNLVAAGVAVALHGLVLAVLLANWVTDAPSSPAVRTISMQLMTMPAPAPVIEPPALIEPPAPPVVAPEPEPVDPRIEQQKLEQAALARKRVEERKVEQERQRVEQQKREQDRQREQERREQERREHERREHERQQQVQRDEQQRQQAAAQAAREAEAAAAASRQYLPIAKQAPAYPQRALDKGIEGTCTVSYSVNTQGRVENPEVVGDCHPLFIRPSLTAAKSFRYQPRVIDGRAVTVPNVKNTFTYRIE